MIYFLDWIHDGQLCNTSWIYISQSTQNCFKHLGHSYLPELCSAGLRFIIVGIFSNGCWQPKQYVGDDAVIL